MIIRSLNSLQCWILYSYDSKKYRRFSAKYHRNGSCFDPFPAHVTITQIQNSTVPLVAFRSRHVEYNPVTSPILLARL